MFTLTDFMLLLVPPAAVSAAVYTALRAVKRGVKPPRAILRHMATLVVTFAVLVTLSVAVSAQAEAEPLEADTVAAVTDSGAKGIGLLSAGLSTGLAGIGGGIALAGGIPAAIGATAEDPKNFAKALIFVALGETIALYGIVISVLIMSRL